MRSYEYIDSGKVMKTRGEGGFFHHNCMNIQMSMTKDGSSVAGDVDEASSIDPHLWGQIEQTQTWIDIQEGVPVDDNRTGMFAAATGLGIPESEINVTSMHPFGVPAPRAKLMAANGENRILAQMKSQGRAFLASLRAPQNNHS